MLVRLPQLDVTRLAADFSAAVRAAHTPLELDNIRARNTSEPDPHVDHVHDYTDAADLMAEAVHQQLAHVEDWTALADDMALAQKRAKAAGYRLSRVLIACEWSGTVRDEFTARGHSAASCDVLPSATAGEHYQRDVREILGDGWHMMLSFPPCTYLTSSQLWRCNPKHDPTGERARKSDEALQFVRDLMAAPIERQALENPRGRIGTAIRKADQEIQPYQFGHDVSKTTGLWLENLPPLKPDPADYVPPRRVMYRGKLVNRWSNQSPCGADSRGPSADRGQQRGKTYRGIARAMAEQWGGIRAALKPPAEPAGQLALF